MNTSHTVHDFINPAPSPAVKLVTGAGPVGWTIATQLANAGHRVRILTRSGSGPEHPLIQKQRADVGQAHQLRAAMTEVDTVFHCIHGSKYNARVWERELPEAERVVLNTAGEVGAVVVFPESLYSYSHPKEPMTERSTKEATGGKRGVRTALLQARAASDTPTVSVVASDFFGPQVLMAHAGDRMVPRILSGKRLQVVGSANAPHSFTYVPDLAAAMIRAAATPSVWNTVLHAPSNPALSQRDLAEAFAAAAEVATPKVSAVPGWVIRAAGIVSTDMRELAETLYQFQEPFVMDSKASQAALGLEPTPLGTAARATVQWWRDRA
ncbi:NAD-dependent epimerase/dehydratase family protein [Arthrobacter glacialis]|uniref:NAD-dependent epimerase/dehydratase family protein n=1 Tax=Arthrobacter glacialis TaxID=1664 RepID=UPI000CD3DEF5|nr:NAD-dependent epimerase/dehydratase family protein [Arthrobacter glacialis]POH58345.1 epimerase [Arthrobacter glacialis]